MFWPADLNNVNIKINIGDFELEVLYINFGLFNYSIGAHSHSKNSYELHYVPCGRGTLIADGEKYDIGPNTLYMTGPDVLHEQIIDETDPMAEYCVCFEKKSGGTRDDEDVSAISRLFCETKFWFGKDRENMAEIFERLAGEVEKKKIGYLSNVKNCLEEIVISLVRNYSQDVLSQNIVPEKTLDHKRIVVIDECFLWHYATITLFDIARRIALSTRQTERFIKKHYNMSFSEKKLEARMLAASNFLVSTTLPIGAIAERTGFSSLGHFCKAFKKYFGVTAKEYRQSNRDGVAKAERI